MSNVKTSKIERLTVSDNPVWTSDKGVPYYGIQLWLENGDQGEALAKTPEDIKPGMAITYTMTSGKYGDKIKVDWRATNGTGGGSFGGGKGGPRGGNAAFALSYAKDLAVAHQANPLSGKPLTSDEIISLATKFKTWLDSNP